MDDLGPVLPTFCHFGDAFALYVRDPATVRQQIDLIAKAGYHGIRFWTMLGGDYWHNLGRDVRAEDRLGDLATFLTELTSRRLVAMVSQGDVREIRNRQLFMHELAGVARAVGTTVAFIDGGNEALFTGETNPNEITRMLDTYRAANGPGLVTLSSPAGETPEELAQWSRPPAMLADVHGYRGGHVPDKIRHIGSIGYEGLREMNELLVREGLPALPLLVSQSEPTGPGEFVSATEHREELDDEALAMMAAEAFIFGRAAWTFMSGEGVYWRQSFVTAPGFRAVGQLRSALPRDLMRFERLCHGGDRWKGTRVLVAPPDTWRCDHAIAADGRCVIAAYGFPGRYDIQVERAFDGDEIHPVTRERMPVQLRPGQMWRVEWRWGRLLVGKVRT